MPTVVVAPSLARWLTPTPTSGAGERAFVVTGQTLREVLEAVFAKAPSLRGYVTDEHGAIRQHVIAFINDIPIRDKQALDNPVPPDGEVHLFQALSGG